jgi:hypothetical protein
MKFTKIHAGLYAGVNGVTLNKFNMGPGFSTFWVIRVNGVKVSTARLLNEAKQIASQIAY